LRTGAFSLREKNETSIQNTNDKNPFTNPSGASRKALKTADKNQLAMMNADKR
jgi:hypothetical protein